MRLIPITTPTVEPGNDFAEIFVDHADVQDGDIVAVSSKALAVSEGSLIDLRTVEPTEEAHEWTKRLSRSEPSPAFRQAVLDETRRLNGRVLEGCDQAMLCDVKPDGMRNGSIVAANAGLDRSNVEEHFAVGWGDDPLHSMLTFKQGVETRTGATIGVLVTDSCCRPRRQGLTAIALTAAGFDPVVSHVGKADIFDRPLAMTHEAIADQLATAANFLMGNAAERIPAVIIRDHGLAFTDYEGWIDGISANEDLFKGI